jgi:hypothetical protein
MDEDVVTARHLLAPNAAATVEPAEFSVSVHAPSPAE